MVCGSPARQPRHPGRPRLPSPKAQGGGGAAGGRHQCSRSCPPALASHPSRHRAHTHTHLRGDVVGQAQAVAEQPFHCEGRRVHRWGEGRGRTRQWGGANAAGVLQPWPPIKKTFPPPPFPKTSAAGPAARSRSALQQRQQQEEQEQQQTQARPLPLPAVVVRALPPPPPPSPPHSRAGRPPHPHPHRRRSAPATAARPPGPAGPPAPAP